MRRYKRLDRYVEMLLVVLAEQGTPVESAELYSLAPELRTQGIPGLLKALVAKGFIAVEEDDSSKRYTCTERGRAMAAAVVMIDELMPD